MNAPATKTLRCDYALSDAILAMLRADTKAGSILLVSEAAQTCALSRLEDVYQVTPHQLTSNHAEILPARVELVIWVGNAHQLTFANVLKALDRLSRITDQIAFAAEPPIHAPDVYPSLLWPDQWAVHFATFGYHFVDLWRDVLSRQNVPEDLAQNLVLFTRKHLLESNRRFKKAAYRTARRLIHTAKISQRTAVDSTGTNVSSISSYLSERLEKSPPLQPFISVIMTFHREGHLAHRSLNGFALMAAAAQQAGIKVELICPVDNANIATVNIVSKHHIVQQLGIIIRMDNRDPSCCRNHGIDAAKGDYIAIIDGDDLYSPQWLVRALARAREFETPVIVHPSHVLSFGLYKNTFYVDDASETKLGSLSPLTENSWVSTSFAPKTIYSLLPYARSDLNETGFGFEDWHWNCETLAAGLLHVVAPETALFYRRKPVSTVMDHSSKAALIRRTAFLHSPHIAALYREVRIS